MIGTKKVGARIFEKCCEAAYGHISLALDSLASVLDDINNLLQVDHFDSTSEWWPQFVELLGDVFWASRDGRYWIDKWRVHICHGLLAGLKATGNYKRALIVFY